MVGLKNKPKGITREKTMKVINNDFTDFFIRTNIHIYIYIYLTSIKANWDTHLKYQTETLVYNMAD